MKGMAERARIGRAREVIARAAMALCAVLLALGIGEGVLRLAGFSFSLFPRTIQFGWPDPETLDLDYTPHPTLLWAPKGYEERVARAAASPPDIVFMGDSCTEFSDYDARLRELLREGAGLADVRTANFGVAGWSSFQGRQQLTHDIAMIRPRIVTVYFGWNDHWYGFEASDAAAQVVSSPLYGHLREIRLFQLLTKAYFQAVRPSSRPLRVSPEDFRGNLISIVRSARKAGIIAMLLTAPTSLRRGSEPAYLEERWIDDRAQLLPLHQEYVKITREVAVETGAPLCDLERKFRTASSEGDLSGYFMDDGIHLQPEGSQKVAEMLYECFVDHSLLGALAPGAPSSLPRGRDVAKPHPTGPRRSP
jgi:lysophospholipase L1-like esterase